MSTRTHGGRPDGLHCLFVPGWARRAGDVSPLRAAHTSGGWDLYVASDQITDDNFDVAYGEVVRLAGVVQDPWFDLFQVKLIGGDDPLAKAAADVHTRYPGRTPIRLQGATFGSVAAEEVYLYPSPLPVPIR